MSSGVPAGSIFGFLGRNDAGKTTTIKTLMGLLRADSGAAHVFGTPVADADHSAEIRRRIGFVTEDKRVVPLHNGWSRLSASRVPSSTSVLISLEA
jgi:ABC-type multidrug transport system ATPase subunit